MTYRSTLTRESTISRSVVCSSILLFDKIQLSKLKIIPIALIILLNGCREKENLPSQKEVVSFVIKNVSGTVTIDHKSGDINMVVPYGTVRTNLVPEIKISDGASIVPRSFVAQDFTKPVYYTVTGPDGSKRIYKVTLDLASQPFHEILALSRDTIQAGDTLGVIGLNFGTFALAITTQLKEKISGEETSVPFKLLDSTRILMLLPPTLNASNYNVVIVKNKIRKISKITVNVRIHNPVITALRKSHLMQGDTLVIAGNFILPEQYNYRILLTGEKDFTVVPIVSQEGRLAAITATNIVPGAYNLALINTTERTTSMVFSQKIVIYDGQLPFVTGIVDPKKSYDKGTNVRFKTTNFSNINARFFSVQMISKNSQYVQNGIFSKTDQLLSINIPPDIPSQQYQIKVNFLNDSGDSVYEVELNDQIIIN